MALAVSLLVTGFADGYEARRGDAAAPLGILMEDDPDGEDGEDEGTASTTLPNAHRNIRHEIAKILEDNAG